MHITKLKMQNFSCCQERELTLRPGFNLIVGDNGTGKTSMLNGLAIAAGSLFLGFPEPAKSRTIAKDEVHRRFFTQGQTVTAEPQFPCVISCEGTVSGETGYWTRELTAVDGRTSRQQSGWIKGIAEGLRQSVQNGEPVVLPAVSYYGTGRLWVQLSETEISTLPPETRFAGYRDCLNPASNEKRLVEWFKTQELTALQKKVEIGVLEASRKAITECVPDATNVFFDVQLDQLVLEINGENVPFAYLSDGYRNMLAMVCDLAVKCSTLNPHLEANAPAETPGVVLIDEIDLHLHPKWQRRVVSDLTRAFPNIQFVATTHSPFVIQSLPRDKDIQLVNLDGAEADDIYEMSVEDIAEYVQGVELPSRIHRFV